LQGGVVFGLIGDIGSLLRPSAVDGGYGGVEQGKRDIQAVAVFLFCDRISWCAGALVRWCGECP